MANLLLFNFTGETIKQFIAKPSYQPPGARHASCPGVIERLYAGSGA